MAEFLLDTRNGNIVHVEADGSQWDYTFAKLPKFLVVRIVGMGLLEAGDYLGPVMAENGDRKARSKARIEFRKYLTGVEINKAQFSNWYVPEVPFDALVEEK